MSRQKFLLSRQDFMELCHDREFYVATECGQEQGALCCDTTFCVVTELVKVRSFLSRQSISLSRQSLALGRVFVSRQNILYRDRVWPNGEVLCCDREFYVTT